MKSSQNQSGHGDYLLLLLFSVVFRCRGIFNLHTPVCMCVVVDVVIVVWKKSELRKSHPSHKSSTFRLTERTRR